MSTSPAATSWAALLEDHAARYATTDTASPWPTHCRPGHCYRPTARHLTMTRTP